MTYTEYNFTKLKHLRRGEWLIRCYCRHGHMSTTEYSWSQYEILVKHGTIDYICRDLESGCFDLERDRIRRQKIFMVMASKLKNILKSLNRGGVTYTFYVDP